jgi:hypothetical protein
LVLRGEGGTRARQRKAGSDRRTYVAEVLLGLLKDDHLAYINVEPTWKPDLDAGSVNSMSGLIKFAAG